ncbi:MAG: HAD family hydrolase [Chloroflexia bacterium]|nr:HAD family hydrolase [Chloroflexia bacterium]
MSKNKTIFLDRDGVINDNSVAYYVYKVEDFIINPGVIESLKSFQSKGYQLIVITNQGGIAKKQYDNQDVELLNRHLEEELNNEGIKLKDILHCPHHSNISKCLCRKPGTLLFEKAIAKYNVDTSASFMIGDSDRDVVASEKVGVKGIKVEANNNLFEAIRKTEFSYLVD